MMSGPRPPLLKAGFTLIEVLLVLVILVILASFAVTYFTGTRDRANIDAARTQIGLVKSAIRFYHLHMNQYPTALEELTTSPSDSSKSSQWAGPYLEKQVPLDPWGRAYQYVAPGKRSPTTFDIWSLGPDGIDGSDDDIGNWQ
jgi:general secretion pathway protein G